MLAQRLEEGAAKAETERAAKEAAERGDDPDKIEYPKSSRTGRSTSTRGSGGSTGDTISDVLSSPVAKDLMRTAAREILRGVFGVGRR